MSRKRTPTLPRSSSSKQSGSGRREEGMPRVAPLSNQKGEVVAYMFECPGCGMWHSPYIRKDGDGSNPVWSFNGDTERPTFSPSLLVRVRGESPVVCHSFVRDGRIQFLNDCTHELAGQTVDLPEIDNSA